MNIGVRAHDFGKLPFDELMKKIKGKGFSSVQLAPYKAIEELGSDSAVLDEAWINRIGNECRENNIKIAVLGCYINPVDIDEVEREKALNKFKEHIRFSKTIGSNIVATETGSLNRDLSFHIENNSDETFDEITHSVRELVAEAEKQDVFVGIEGVTRHTISTPKKIKKLLDAIDSRHLQIVFDPVNLIDITNYERQDDIIRESVLLFGDRISIVHAKDFVFEGEAMIIVPPGKGLLNYKLLLSLLMPMNPNMDYLIEGVHDSEMEQSKLFLEKLNTSLKAENAKIK